MSGSRTPRQAWQDAWNDTLVMIWDEIPLVVGAILVAVLHGAQQRIAIDDGVIRMGLGLGKWTLMGTLALTKGVDFLGVIGESLGLAYHRTMTAFREGKRTALPPRL